MQVRVWYHLDARFGASRFMVHSALEIRTLAQIASPRHNRSNDVSASIRNPRPYREAFNPNMSAKLPRHSDR